MCSDARVHEQVETLEAKAGRKGHIKLKGSLPVGPEPGQAASGHPSGLHLDVQALELRSRNLYTGAVTAGGDTGWSRHAASSWIQRLGLAAPMTGLGQALVYLHSKRMEHFVQKWRQAVRLWRDLAAPRFHDAGGMCWAQACAP